MQNLNTQKKTLKENCEWILSEEQCFECNNIFCEEVERDSKIAYVGRELSSFAHIM